MSAPDHLNKPLFHGSSIPLKPGDIIRPSSHVGFTQYSDVSGYSRGRGEHVFMHHDEHEAWNWANGPAESDRHSETYPLPYDQRSPRVYEVEPIGGHFHPRDADVPGGELISGERVTQRGQGARVVRENVIPPPDDYIRDERQGKQGELPGVNWNSQRENWRNGSDRNSTLRRERPHARVNKTEGDLRGVLDKGGSLEERKYDHSVFQPKLFDHNARTGVTTSHEEIERSVKGIMDLL